MSEVVGAGVRSVFDGPALRLMKVYDDLTAGTEVRLVLVADFEAGSAAVRRARAGEPNAAVLRLRRDGTAEAVFRDFSNAGR